MFGTVDEFFYKNIAGVKMASPGFKEIVIKPQILGELTSSNAHVESIRGPITSMWEKDGNSITLNVDVPGNTSATVYVPTLGMQNVTVTENGATVWRNGEYVEGVPGIIDGAGTDAYIEFEVGSGDYQFQAFAR